MTTESSSYKAGHWIIAIEGLPYAFSTDRDTAINTLPAGINDILRGIDDDYKPTTEYNATILPVIKTDTQPAIASQSRKLFSDRVAYGDMRFTIIMDAAGKIANMVKNLAPAAAYYNSSVEWISDYSSATIPATFKSTINVGDIVYFGSETAVVTAVSATEITVNRQAYGSVGSINSPQQGDGIYLSPPFITGRKVLLIRAFETTIEVRWAGYIKSFSISAAGEISFICMSKTPLDMIKSISHGYTFGDDEPNKTITQAYASITNAQWDGKKIIGGGVDGNGLPVVTFLIDGYLSISAFSPDIIKVGASYAQIDKTLCKITETATSLFRISVYHYVTYKGGNYIYDGCLLRGYYHTASKYIEVGKAINMGADNYPAADVIIDNILGIEAYHCIDVSGVITPLEDVDTPSNFDNVIWKLLLSRAGNDTVGAGYDIIPIIGKNVNSDILDISEMIEQTLDIPAIDGSLVIGWDGQAFKMGDVINQSLLQMLGGFLLQKYNGKITIKIPNVAKAYENYVLADITTITHIDTADIITAAGAGSMGLVGVNEPRIIGYTDIITDGEIEIKKPIYNYNESYDGSNKKNTTISIDTEALRYYDGGVRNTLKINARAINGDKAVNSLVALWRAELGARGYRAVPYIQFTIRYAHYTIELGDFVTIDLSAFSHLFNPNSGTYSYPDTLVCEVTGVEINLASDNILLTILPLNLAGNANAGVIAPAATVASVSGTTITFNATDYTDTHDIATFTAGDYVRFYRPSTGAWQNYQTSPLKIVSINETGNSCVLSRDESANIAVGDIMEYAEYPTVNDNATSADKTRQFRRLFLAYDGSNDSETAPEYDEYLPSDYTVPTYNIDPYEVL